MITITSGEWIADLGALKCRNMVNGIVVVFKKKGKFYQGKIQHIPDELMVTWAQEKNGATKTQEAVLEAEEVFMHVYFESDIEKHGIRGEWMKDN